MPAAPLNPADDWKFDHLALVAAPGDPAVAGLADLLGLTPGYRPPFPFGGAWYYQGERALLHVIDAPAEQRPALHHIAFRSPRPLAEVLPDVAATGLPHRVMRLPETAMAQVFIQTSEHFLLELDVPAGDAGAAIADYPLQPPE